MNYSEQILKMAHNNNNNNNNGIVTSAQVTKAGILREHLRGLVDKGLLERSGRGVYIIPTVFDDEIIKISPLKLSCKTICLNVY